MEGHNDEAGCGVNKATNAKRIKGAGMPLRKVSLMTAILVLIAGSLALPGRAAKAPSTLPQMDLTEVLQMANIQAPPPGVGVLVHADFPRENPLQLDGGEFAAITLDVTSNGVVTRSAIAADGGENSDEKVKECTDPTFASVGKRWSAQDLPVEYGFNVGSEPRYLSPWLTIRSMKQAHKVWGETNTKCDDDDAIDFSFKYMGEVGAHIKYDDLSVTDFGRLEHAVAMSYVWYTNARIREVDMRFNKAYFWTNRPGIERFNVKNVAVHEIGHHLGLDDLASPHSALTMYGIVSRGELRKTTLGRGDIKGAELLTP